MSQNKTPEAVAWTDATSMQDWLIRMVESGQGKTPEVQTAIELFGRSRFKNLWEEHKQKKQGEKC